MDSNPRERTLAFTIYASALQGRSEIGFSFRAYPETPTLTLGNDSHEIILNDPILTIKYTD